MKKAILLSVIFLILLSSTVFATVSLDVKWQTAVETLRPGAETTIALTLSNTGTTDLTNVVITPNGGPSITVTSGVTELGGLPAYGSSQGSISLRADKTAESKTSYVYLKVQYYTGTGTYDKTFTIPISIKREPILQIINVNYSDIVSPGKTITVKFDVKNSGLGPAKDLIVSLDQTSKLFSIPSSAGEVVIESLGSEETTTVPFTITVDPEADVGINSIPVILTYFDETKVNSYTDTKYIGLTVTGKIDFVVTVIKTGSGVAEISIANRGTAPAEYLAIKATSGSTSKEYYIGTLDSGDYESIDFPQPGMGNFDVTLDLVYRDKFNNDYVEEKKVTVNPTFELNPGLLAVLVIILVGTFWYYNKNKKKK
jgi:hypothetical protein